MVVVCSGCGHGDCCISAVVVIVVKLVAQLRWSGHGCGDHGHGDHGHGNHGRGHPGRGDDGHGGHDRGDDSHGGHDRGDDSHGDHIRDRCISGSGRGPIVLVWLVGQSINWWLSRTVPLSIRCHFTIPNL